MNTRKFKTNKIISINRYFFVPIALILFFLTFYMIYEDIKSNTINEFNNEQLILAETASQGITSFFDYYESELVFIAQLKEIIDFSEESKAFMANYYETHKSIVTAVTRIDTTGVILYTYPYNQSVIGQDISYQDHIQQVIIDHKPVLSDVFMSAQGFLAIAMHVPVFKNKNYVGSLSVLIPIDRLGKLYLEKIKNRKKGHAWLLSENGIEIYCPISGHTGKSILETTKHDASSVEMLETINNNSTGTGKSIHQEVFDNDKTKLLDLYYAFYRVPLGNTYWTILISYQEEDVYIALSRLRNRLIFVFSLLFIALSFYFYSLTKVRNFLKEEAKRKEVEKILFKSEEKFRKIFDDHAAVKLILDPNTGNIVDANKSAANYYGWSCEELIKMNIGQLNGLSAQEITKNIENILSKNKNQFEFKHQLKDGSIRDVEVLSSTINIDNNDVLHSIIYDITDRKNAEVLLKEKTDKIASQNEEYLCVNEELNQRNQELIIAKEKAEESDHLKTSFLQNISHEIRTPMNAVVGFSSFLNDPDLLPEKRKYFTDIIIQSSDQLLSIINDIVSIASIESGHEKVQGNEININLICKLINEQFFLKDTKPNVTCSLQTSLADDEAIIITDSTKLTQILTNLIGNALKFTKKGFVNFGYTLKDDFLEFYVEDSGIGIPSDMHAEIFKRFRQAEKTTARMFGGSGLGLSISKAYVEMLGGTIWLNSEPGKGSVFYFTLPYKKVNSKTISKLPVNELNLGFTKSKTVLIAEDEDYNFILLEQYLSDMNITIIRAVNGIEAVAICKSNPQVDLVLMDMKMPEMDGFEATKRIKEFRPNLAIIAQSAYSSKADKNKAFACGCSDFISKPFKREMLLSKIKEQLLK
ncbi:ATP-binding protein [Labilibaculum antarcticum]|uniref:histidine kinase n=1 Tax=Labilibaculum antarcticum TaxID=1717717 RepID=A0A1Y1CN10_9BACT|nr:ATP-binding protein [Labilibaculum antarcticum]BAX81745.1 hybrid sensor histidine kinase/response regulator [Labilibaculum antarcticum]